MSNTEKRNDDIINETMQELYDSIEASRKMKEKLKAEDELAALQAELDEDEDAECVNEAEEARKAEEARRRAQARKRAAAKKAAEARKAAEEQRAAAKKATEESALSQAATTVIEEINLDDVPDMTAASAKEEVEIDDEEKPAKSGKVKKIILAVLASVFGVMILVYAGFAIFFNSHFMFNTTVNGNDYSLKNVKAVEDDMESQVQGYTLTIKESDGDTELIEGQKIALEYVETDEISNLVSSQNNFLWITSLWENQELETKVAVQYDEVGLEKILENLPCMDPENQVVSQNAKPEFDGTQYVITEEVIGTEIEEKVFIEAVKTAVEGFQYELVLSETECYKLPKYISTSEEVIAACEQMNVYVSSEIVYDFHPHTEVVDAARIAKWLKVNDKMEVKFKNDSIKKYLAKLGKKYDTWRKDRTFKAADGDTVTVSGGAYGWLLWEAEEYKQLKKDIKKGEKIEREPIFYSYGTAVEHTETDWGNTYAEVDLTDQKMYFIKDGNVVLETPVVTGNPNKGNATPQGVYSLTYKTKDAVLRGQRDENGVPEYETPVAFWMPFNGGIGFHDATWQSSFGGSRYLTNGSHGCINMPYSKAGELYDLIPDKCPVICHY